MLIFSIGFGAAAIFYFCIGFYVINENPRSSLNRTFFLLCLSFGTWSFFYAFVFQQYIKEAVWLWFKLAAIGFCTFGGISLHFLMLVAKRRVALFHLLLFYIPPIFFVIKAWTGFLTAKDFTMSIFGWLEVIERSNPWFIAYLVHFSLCILLGLFFVFEWRKRTLHKREKRQATILLATVGISFLSGSFFNIILPILEIYVLPAIAPLTSVIWAVGCFYAISKYRLLSITPVSAAKEIVLNMKDILLLTDENRSIKMVNKAFMDLTGFKEHEVIDKNIEYILGNEGFKDLTEKNGKGLPYFEKEIDIADVQGNRIPMRLFFNLILDKNGEPLGYAVVGHDLRTERELLKNKDELEEKVKERTAKLQELNEVLVSEIEKRKQLERDLKESEERYRIAIENAKDGIAIVKGNIHVYANKRFAEIFGYEDVNEIIGKPIDIVLHEDEIARVVDLTTRRQRGERVPEEYEFVGRTKNGDEINVEIFATRIHFKGEPHSLVYIRDTTEKKRQEERLRFISLHDTLTGLYNRHFFEGEMNRVEDGRFDPVGIILCDLDALKFINDTLGHRAGDQFIKETARIIKGSFRKSDIVARIGGDEFAVILPKSNSQQVERLNERIGEYLERHNMDEKVFPISLSTGWAVRDDPRKSMMDIFREADDMMYRIKLSQTPIAKLALIESFKKHMRRKDYPDRGHIDRMFDICSRFSKYLSLSQEDKKRIEMLAIYHDIGKVAIDDAILLKNGPLTMAEKKERERHCDVGCRIAKNSEDLFNIADLILKHHEKWDGSGYPFHLKGEEIPLECRIICIVGAYEAMTATSSNSNHEKVKNALSEIDRLKGIEFDPNVAKNFVEFIKNS